VDRRAAGVSKHTDYQESEPIEMNKTIPYPARGALLLAYGVLLVGLPLAVAGLGGEALDEYLSFPPMTHPHPPGGFSWAVFGLMALVILLGVGPFLLRILSSAPAPRPVSFRRRRFPLWGWGGVGLLIAAWLVAWNRFAWVGALQNHTFTPLWLGYIVVINALSVRRGGGPMLTERPGLFVLLFPVSAVFWWSFEYLNRFVENWYYVGVQAHGSWEYVLFDTLPFSTVLPAVLGTAQWLATFPGVDRGLEAFWRVPGVTTRGFAVVSLASGALGLMAMVAWPRYTYPLVWMAPAFALFGIQGLAGETPPLVREVARGDWRRVWRSALAGLICGLCWEMWNAGSFAHWVYSVPQVQGWRVFEMPLLGYAGYLPFGVTCAAAMDFVLPSTRSLRMGQVG
jgi:hypothetical protein